MPFQHILPSVWVGEVCQNSWGAHLRSSVSRRYFSAASERWSREDLAGERPAGADGHPGSTAQFPREHLNLERQPSFSASSAHAALDSSQISDRSAGPTHPRPGSPADILLGTAKRGPQDPSPATSRHWLPPLKPPSARGPERNKYFSDIILAFRAAFRARDQARVEKLSQIYFQKGGHPFEWMFNARITLCSPRHHRHCNPQRQVALAQRILAEAKSYLKPSTEAYCALISVCGAAGQPELGESYLAEVEQPDEFTFSAAIAGWAGRGKVKKAREVFERMKGMGPAVQPSTSSYNALLNAYAKSSQLQGGLDLVKEMKARGLTPSVFTFNILIAMYARVADVEGALGVWREMKEAGLKGCDVTRSSLLYAFRQQPNLPHHIWEEIRDEFLATPPPPSPSSVDKIPLDLRHQHAAKWARDFFGVDAREAARRAGPGTTTDEGGQKGVPDGVQVGSGWRSWLAEVALEGWQRLGGGGRGEGPDQLSEAPVEGARKYLSRGPRLNGGPPDGVYRVVDLHGFSVIESTLMVMDCLERLGAEAAASSNPEGLVIICGINNVTCHRHLVNGGRLYVSPRNVSAFHARQQDLGLSHRWRQTALARFVVIGGAIGAIWSVHHVTAYYASLALP